MFTGIIETFGIIATIEKKGTNFDFWIYSAITPELKIDQSVAHNGVCLTVVEKKEDQYRVIAVEETIKKTNLGNWKVNDKINLERALKLGDRLDGHFVQGHVDATGICTTVQQLEGSWLFRFEYAEKFSALIIEKGSICINGVSLTVFNIGRNEFSVTIIPYTFEHTNFQSLQKNDVVNLEFDVLGKYLLRQKSIME